MNQQHLQAAAAFGAELIQTGDLDPVYVAASTAKGNELKRLVLAYSCVYHLGAAAKIATAKSALGGAQAAWRELETAAINESLAWPRGAERRHWRGANALASFQSLRWRYGTPEEAVDYWANGKTFAGVTARVQESVGFGPWIAFKIADVVERVLRVPVAFASGDIWMYRDPRQGAALIAEGDKNAVLGPGALVGVAHALLYHPKLKKLKAPPWCDRPLNIQEVETILCKYKSHVNGHYPMGKDTKEVQHGLTWAQNSDVRGAVTLANKMWTALDRWRYA